MSVFDVLVVGGGIAGVSIAYELAADHKVALIDMEPTLAFHTTGRSAAMFLESYGGPAIRALTTASRSFLNDPPWECDAPLLTGLAMLHVAGPGRGDAVRELHRDVSVLVPGVELLDADAALAVQPMLRPGHVELALLEPDAMEIDVHALHQGYVRGLRRRGGEVVVSAAARHAEFGHGAWTVGDADRCWTAPVVVNAAGAWADQLARIVGADPVGLRPLRRTAFMVAAPPGLDARRLPMVADVDDEFYLKPDGHQLLCSPADETPQEPGDARADQTEIARALDAIAAATTLRTRHVTSSWAGLRTFAADRAPVVGHDPHVDGLFWFAGQGGYGIQTAPALARTGAALLSGRQLPPDVVQRGLIADALAPGRAGIGW